MKVWQAGLQKVVSTMGSMVSQRQAELIAETTGASGTAILLFDEDEAGRKGRRAAWERLNRHVRVHVIRFPDEGTQPDDLEPEALRELVQKAAG
jgi:DNA primase